MPKRKKAEENQIEDILNEWDLNNIQLNNQYDSDVDFYSGDSDGASTSMDSIFGEVDSSANSFSIDFSDEHGINDLFAPVRKAKQVQIKNAKDLKEKGFIRIANSNYVIQKSTRDLWTLRKDADGKFIVEQLFEDEEEPLKDTF